MCRRAATSGRAWSDEQLDAAEARLTVRGWLTDGAFTDAGRAAREEIEVAPDAQTAVAIRALGEDVDVLFGLLEPWGVGP